MKTISRSYLVDRESVCFIKFIFEAYDGIALLSTVDPYAAKIELRIAPGCAAEVDQLVADLGRDYLIEPLD